MITRKLFNSSLTSKQRNLTKPSPAEIRRGDFYKRLRHCKNKWKHAFLNNVCFDDEHIYGSWETGDDVY